MEYSQEEWVKLCAQAASEQDNERLMQLIRRMVQLLDVKEESSKQNDTVQQSDPSSNA